MVIYHTVRLTECLGEKTVVFDVETKEECVKSNEVHQVIDELNKSGYYLTAVASPYYYLTKRVD